MDTVEKFRRYLGIPLPYGMAMVVSILGSLWEWIQKHFSEPEVLRRELAKRKTAFLEADRSDREQLCDRIAQKGRWVLEMRSLHGKFAWDGVLAELHVSRRTATNYVALFLFSATNPVLYERFRVLGPTKLYRLARVAPERLKNMTLDTPVQTQDGLVPLRRATDRQLESALRLMFPPKRSTQAEKIQQAAARIAKLASNWPASEAPREESLRVAAVAISEAANALSSLSTALRKRLTTPLASTSEAPPPPARDPVG